MKRYDTTTTERSLALNKTFKKLSMQSHELRTASLRLRENSKELMERVRKNIRPKKAVRSASDQAQLKEHNPVQTLAGNQTVQAAAEVQ
jgi:hypothetical protein